LRQRIGQRTGGSALRSRSEASCGAILPRECA
jgi:hypothetical protein